MSMIGRFFGLPVMAAFFCLFGMMGNAFAVVVDGVEYPFSLTTTNLNANDNFQFGLSARGTFYVDCGANGTLSGDGVSGGTITKNNTNYNVYTCTYTTSGSKTIQFGGTATEYTWMSLPVFKFNNPASDSYTSHPDVNAKKVASIYGNLSVIFPKLGDNSFPKFRYTFYGCTSLTVLPENLFANITTGGTNMFLSTFGLCTGLTGYIPPILFEGLIQNNVATNTFDNTFSGTAMLTSCPSGTTPYATNYTSAWGGKVSCQPSSGETQIPTYSVTYTCGNGTGTAPVDNITHESGSDVTVPTAYETLAIGFGGCVGPAPQPRLDYWDCGNNGHVNPGGTFTVNANTTCDAKWGYPTGTSVDLVSSTWNSNQHKIFRYRQIGAYLGADGDGGYGTLPMSTNENPLSNNNIPTREGYTFAGYYSQCHDSANQPVGTKYIDSDGYITTAGINAARWSDTFYLCARWVQNNPDNPDNPNNPETPDNPTDPDPVNPAEPEDPDPVNPVDPDPIITPVGPGTNGTTVACAAGKYLPKNGTVSADCTNCESGYFCPRDGNYVAGASVTQGRYSCLPGGVQNGDRKSCRVVLDKSQLLYGLSSGEECWQKTNTDEYVECMMRDVHRVE